MHTDYKRSNSVSEDKLTANKYIKILSVISEKSNWYHGEVHYMSIRKLCAKVWAYETTGTTTSTQRAAGLWEQKKE